MNKYSLQYEITSEFFSQDFGRLVRINGIGDKVAILGLSFHGGNPKPDVQLFNLNSNTYEVIEEPIISHSGDERIEEFTFGNSGNIINLRINQNFSTFHNYNVGSTITDREDEVEGSLAFHNHIRFADNEKFIATNSTYGIYFYEYNNEKWVNTMDTIKVETSLVDIEISQNKEIAIVSTWGLNNSEDEVHIYKLSSTVSAFCLLYTSPSPRDGLLSRMPSSA